jgi:tRNA G18 (ribose-2'-O)-methylase SpoU
MFEIRPITALSTPELKPYATLRRSVEHAQQGLFVAEGEKVVRRLLHSRFTVISLVVDDKWLAEFRPLLATRPEPIIVYLAKKELLETLVGFDLFQGALAVGKIPAPTGNQRQSLPAPGRAQLHGRHFRPARGGLTQPGAIPPGPAPTRHPLSGRPSLRPG